MATFLATFRGKTGDILGQFSPILFHKFVHEKSLEVLKFQGFRVVRLERLELPTPWFVAKYSDPTELQARNDYDTTWRALCQKLEKIEAVRYTIFVGT